MSDDPKEHRPAQYIESAQSFRGNFDQYVSWTPQVFSGTSPTGVARAVQVNYQRFQPNDIASYAPEFYNQLVTFFNNYQYFRLKKIKCTWQPRYNNPGDVIGRVNSLLNQSRASGEVPPYNPNGTPYQVLADTYIETFSEAVYITMIPDRDDTYVRDNNLDEYYKVRSLPMACNGSITEAHSMNLTPTVLEVDVWGFVNTGTAGTQNQQGPITNTGFSSAVNGAAVAGASEPVPMPWQATKAAQNVNNNQIGLNIQQTLFGFKSYIYSPHNNATLYTGSIYIGRYQWEYDFEFKTPEFRGPVTGLQFSMEADTIKKLNMLRQMKGELYLLEPKHTTPTLGEVPLRTAYRKRALEEGEQPPELNNTSKAFKNIDEDNEALKIKPSQPPSAQPTSRHTPTGPSAHTLPARLGLR